jgi:hypothetical protein
MFSPIRRTETCRAPSFSLSATSSVAGSVDRGHHAPSRAPRVNYSASGSGVPSSHGPLTLTWPHAQPLLLDAPLNLPDGWPEAAAQYGLVLLFVGDSVGLRDPTEAHQSNPEQRAPQAAERGELAAGAITYSGTYSGQQQQPHPVRPADLQPTSRVHRWPRTPRWQLHTTH